MTEAITCPLCTGLGCKDCNYWGIVRVMGDEKLPPPKPGTLTLRKKNGSEPSHD